MDETQKLKERISSLTDDELVTMVTTEAGDYRQEALDFARAELRVRGINETQLSQDDAEREDDELEGKAASLQGDTVPFDFRKRECLACASPLRMGTIVAEKEVTIIFSDNREERFIRV